MTTVHPAAARHPLDAERERLRQAGFSDKDIHHILIEREIGAGRGPGALGTGIVSGVLNNLGAVAAHVRALIPGFQADFTNLLDRRSTPAARTSAVVTLTLKATVIVVLGYLVSLEYAQMRAEACSAKMKAIIDTVPMNKLFEAGKSLEKECTVP